MIYRMTSSQEIVAKIFADLDIKEDGQRISDIMEWISEAVEKIGAVRQLKKVVSGADGAEYIEIKDHQAQLPLDLYRLNAVAYAPLSSGPYVSIKRATGNFGLWSGNVQGGEQESVSSTELIEAVKILYAKYVEDPIYPWFSKLDNKTALDILNSNANVKTLLMDLMTKSPSGVKGVMYTIKPGYIVSNAAYGYLKLSYDAMYRDEDGYLMIPDLASYKEAIYWYVTMKLKYPEYLSGRMNREIYYDIRRSWNFYCKQAYGEAMMPDQEDMITIKNNWLRLVPNVNAEDTFYDDLANREYIYNQN